MSPAVPCNLTGRLVARWMVTMSCVSAGTLVITDLICKENKPRKNQLIGTTDHHSLFSTFGLEYDAKCTATTATDMLSAKHATYDFALPLEGATWRHQACKSCEVHLELRQRCVTHNIFCLVLAPSLQRCRHT